MSNSFDNLLIGIDGGGTGCRVALGTARLGVLAEVSGGHANVATGFDAAIRNIRNAAEAAASKCGRDPADLGDAVAHLGLAGVMTPEDSKRVATALPFARSIVTDDRPTAVFGALGGGDGFLASIGTGTIVASKKDGQLRYAGGWGFYVADQASGAWLGRMALDRTLQCHDGLMEHTALSRAILARFHGDPSEITAFSITSRPGDYGTLAPIVIQLAQDGDTVARAIVSEGVDYIVRALGALGFQGGDTLCLTGGVGPNYATLLAEKLSPKLVAPKHSSVHGAFQLALRAHHQSGRVVS